MTFKLVASLIDAAIMITLFTSTIILFLNKDFVLGFLTLIFLNQYRLELKINTLTEFNSKFLDYVNTTFPIMNYLAVFIDKHYLNKKN